jgi:hypothetical protein
MADMNELDPRKNGHGMRTSKAEQYLSISASFSGNRETVFNKSKTVL